MGDGDADFLQCVMDLAPGMPLPLNALGPISVPNCSSVLIVTETGTEEEQLLKINKARNLKSHSLQQALSHSGLAFTCHNHCPSAALPRSSLNVQTCNFKSECCFAYNSASA